MRHLLWLQSTMGRGSCPRRIGDMCHTSTLAVRGEYLGEAFTCICGLQQTSLEVHYGKGRFT